MRGACRIAERPGICDRPRHDLPVALRRTPARGLSIGTQRRSARLHFTELEEGGFQMMGAGLDDSHTLPVTADAPYRCDGAAGFGSIFWIG